MSNLINCRQATMEAVREAMEADPRVVYLGECVDGVYGDRSYEMPISEAAFTGLGVGAALAGLRPIVEIMFGDFLTFAMDPIVNQAAKIRYMFGGMASVPLVIRAPFGACGGMAAQHTQSLESWFAGVPGLKVVTPATPHDAKGLMHAAIRDDNPVLFCEARNSGITEDLSGVDCSVAIGKAAVVRPGSDVSIVTYGATLQTSLAAAQILSEQGIDAEVIDLRTVLPIDKETILASVAKTGRLVTVAESHAPCSVASEVATIVMENAFHCLKAPLRRVHPKFAPIPFSRELMRELMPQVDGVVRAVNDVVK